MKHTSTLHFNAEKTHSVRYDSNDSAAVCRTIYINKAVMGSKPYPRSITITVESQET